MIAGLGAVMDRAISIVVCGAADRAEDRRGIGGKTLD